jgi:RNA-directed DNA polymerase
VVEADIKGLFKAMKHDLLMDMLAKRTDDKAFLKLIRKWLKAGILEADGQVIRPLMGTPQGGNATPLTQKITFISL